MSDYVDARCPHCGAPLPPRAGASIVECPYCHRTLEVAGAKAPSAPRVQTAELPRLVEEAQALMVEVERTSASVAAAAAGLDEATRMLGQQARKKVEARLATTRKAIEEGDEATLRECVERLRMLRTLGTR